MSTTAADSATAQPADRWASVRSLVHRVTEPAATGLPRWPILLWFPALLLLLLLILAFLGISGSSTGMFWQVFGSGPDPDLIAGMPRAIRSDEWLTQGSWIVSQWSQGFPAVNQVLPGGMDATILLDLPAWHWSTIFRPQAVSLMLFGLDHGLAIRWWLPGFTMMAAGYVMFVSLVPRRPITGALIAVALFYSPLLQWWSAPSNYYPAALCLLAIATVVICLREPRLWVRIVWAVLTGYLAVSAVLTFYPPHIIWAVLVAVAICVGALLTEVRPTGGVDGLGLRRALGRLIPLLISTVAAGVVLGLFVWTRLDTVRAITGTVYPGARIQPTGAVGFYGLVALFSGPFSDSLDNAQQYTGVLGPNSSESATPVLIGLFLVIPLVWFVVHDWRESRRLQWMMIGCIAGVVVLFAFLLIPGWDFASHLLLLDRTTPQRSRIGLALLCVVAITLLVRRLDEKDTSVPWSVSWAATIVAAGSIVVVWAVLADADDPGLSGSEHHRVVAVLFVASVLLYCRARPLLASLAFLIISIVLSAGVNPLYRGIFDLTQTAMGQDVRRINDQHPGTWLGVGNFELSSVLVESGVEAFNGVQLYPPREMWQEVDPSGRYSDEWNRYASLQWQLGTGEPVLRNPQGDVVIGTFDSCSNFAQQHVTYVMAQDPIDQPCVQKIDEATQGPTTYSIYQVTSPAG